MGKIDRNYVSDIDKKLNEFDRTHDLSESQKAEIAKYKSLNESRDNPKGSTDSQGDIWD